MSATDAPWIRLPEENKQLKAENKQLRKELKQLQNGYGSMSREHSQTIVELSDAYFEIDRLKAENAKLRELVRDTLIQTDQYCDKYGIEYEDCADTWGKANADIDRRMRELGFTEADE